MADHDPTAAAASTATPAAAVSVSHQNSSSTSPAVAATHAAPSPSTSTASSLIPSQTMRRRGSSKSNNSSLPPPPTKGAGNTVQNNTTTNRKDQKKKKNHYPSKEEADSSPNNNGNDTNNGNGNGNDTNNGKTSKKKRNRNKKKATNPPPPSKPATATVDSSNTENGNRQDEIDVDTTTKKPPPKQTAAPTKKKTRNRNKNKRNRYPWRKDIPPGAVDPITLDPLDQLPYPPFALAAQPPYDPIPIWPPPPPSKEEEQNNNTQQPQQKRDETEQERQARILQDQWKGLSVTSSSSAFDEKKSNTQTNGDTASSGAVQRTDPQEQEQPQQQQPQETKFKAVHYNLYDGRALAYYCTSQLQFIDPLNRRDLTRPELQNLDKYLQRHNGGFGSGSGGGGAGKVQLNVTQAYDDKGTTLSTAGAMAHTAAGRAQLAQEQAAGLLQALFYGGGNSGGAGGPSPSPLPNTTTNSLAQQYQAYEGSRDNTTTTTRALSASNNTGDVGIYGEAGMMVIDDDINPGLRGGAPSFVPHYTAAGNTAATGRDGTSLWSTSRRIAGTQLQAQEFPSLAATAPAAAAAAPSNGVSHNNNTRPSEQPQSRHKPLPKAKTLSKIGKIVKQTTAEEKQRQWKAREEMIRKAALSNLTFGSTAMNNTLPPESSSSLLTPPPIVGTTTIPPSQGQVERNRALADALGVAPRTVRNNHLNAGWARPVDPLEHFGEELQATIYPDSLIVQAREQRMALVLKIEKKWKTFLQDDKSASLPLSSMDRPSRAFVHQYSDFWNLHTESFDPEPKRYIHCVKTKETRAPYPLLSVAARQWKGPRPAIQPTAGQTTQQLNTVESVPTSSLSDAPRHLTEESETTSSRFDGLLASAPQERPKLDLQPRTLPTELPPMEEEAWSSLELREAIRLQQERREEKARKQQEQLRHQRKALEAAFASDSEEESVDSVASAADDSDEWVEQEPLNQGVDDDQEV